MKFQESVDYLLSLGNEVSAMKLGLENIRKLLDALGNPEKNYVKVQVAGTNGKGSVCAFLDSICRQANIDTGLYTSPHLVSITERIKINGRDISEAAFARLATKTRAAGEELLADGRLEDRPTYFEHVTAMALLAFADAKVELAILETGLGGRLDATTAANADIAVIAQIDHDHQKYLGETLEEIAGEKAAIIHPGSQVVALRQKTAAARVIRERCRDVEADLVWATSDIETDVARNAAPHPTFIHSFKTARRTYAGIEPLILGRHQAQNAALAIGVAELLEDKHFTISEVDITLGLETAVHPGRLEFVGNILLDGAHNPGGAQALADFLDECIDRPIVMIFGVMQDKNIKEIADILFKKAETLVVTQPANSRAFTAEEIADVAPTPAGEKLILTESPSKALDAARKAAANHKQILVTGSLYLVGEIRSIIHKTLDK